MVLVLNKYMQPINVISDKKAFKKLSSDKGEVVDVAEDFSMELYNLEDWRDLSTLKHQMEELGDNDEIYYENENEEIIVTPRIIRVSYTKIPNRRIRRNRRNVIKRDGNQCQYCGKVLDKEFLNVDHVKPKAQGGGNEWTNLVCSCIKCNSKKRDRTPAEAGMELLRKPFKPLFEADFAKYMKRKEYKSWEAFISDRYYSVELKD